MGTVSTSRSALIVPRQATCAITPRIDQTSRCRRPPSPAPVREHWLLSYLQRRRLWYALAWHTRNKPCQYLSKRISKTEPRRHAPTHLAENNRPSRGLPSSASGTPRMSMVEPQGSQALPSFSLTKAWRHTASASCFPALEESIRTYSRHLGRKKSSFASWRRESSW